MDFEQLRHNWQNAKLNNERLSADNRRMARKLAAGRAATARKKLIRCYGVSAVMSLLLPILSPLLVEVLLFPRWLAGVYALFGLVMCVLNICFLMFIRRSDIMSMPTVSALAAVVKIRRYQTYLRTFGIVTGGALILTMFAIAIDHSETHILIAFVVGLVLGLMIGIKKYRRLLSLSQQMQDELKSAINDD